MDIFSKEKRSEIMKTVHSKDSQIEILLRTALWKIGFRYRKNSTSYFGKPDLVLLKYKTVLFVDSCFWHCCPIHQSFPSTRKEFWENKLLGNKQRDLAVTEYYKQKNWKVIRIWEHDIKNNFANTILCIKTSLSDSLL